MSTTELTDTRTEFESARKIPTDIDLEPITSEDEDYESAPPDYQILTYPADFTLEVLHQKWKAKDILIPDFQRGFVWNQAQSSKLIESFLVGLPVPPIFLYSERKSQKFLVIDGQQRLNSIFYFFEGYWGHEIAESRRVFRLSKLNQDSTFSDRTFEDLQDEDKRRLKNAVLRAFIVQQLDPADDTSLYHIFERLNTGGTLLTNQEIRNCLFHGKFIKFINELNKVDDWRRILGKDKPDTRGKDVELLVRFFAMRNIVAYTKPMKDFLSKFMKKNRDASEETLRANRDLFERTCHEVIASLGPKPFHVRAGLNVAVLDAVMTAFSNHLHEIPADVSERYARLKKDIQFKKNTESGTTAVDAVRERLGQANATLFG